MNNIYIDDFIIILKTFILSLYTLNMETSRTFSDTLENFKLTQALCWQPNILKTAL